MQDVYKKHEIEVFGQKDSQDKIQSAILAAASKSLAPASLQFKFYCCSETSFPCCPRPSRGDGALCFRIHTVKLFSSEIIQ